MAACSVINAIPSVTSLILIVFSLTLFLVYYFKRKYSYWERRHVPQVKPTLFFGNTKDLTFQRVPTAFVFQRIYKELDGHEFGGYYRMTKPSLMLRDPDLIRTFLIKNFSSFHDRNNFLDEKLDPLEAQIANLTGQRWKNVRSKLSPVFSSSKLKHMQDLMMECIEELGKYLNNATSVGSKTAGVQNLQELMTKVTTDVIGSCAFGFRCECTRDENSEFRTIMRRLKPGLRFQFRNMLRFTNSRLISLLKVKAVDAEVENFFLSNLLDAVKHREAFVEKRKDFLQLLIDVQADEKKQLQSNDRQQSTQTLSEDKSGMDKTSCKSTSDVIFTDNVVAANAFAFFTAGFETTALTLSFCLYEMALNPDIYEKMRGEVESVKQAHNGNLDYNALKELVYMESVISETLRMHPPAPQLNRRCTESFQIPGTPVVVEEGTNITISPFSLQHDPRYFPEPEKFLPERFSEENKHSIKPGTYLPFGDGPRICIGMRFALFQMKSVLSYLVSNFTVHTCEKTVIPLKFSCTASLHRAEGGIWVRFQRRPYIEKQ